MKKKIIILIIIITTTSLLARIPYLTIKSADYNVFLEEWFNFLKSNGGILAINKFSGDYTFTYVFIMSCLTYLPIKSLYSIKTVSIIFDFIMALISLNIVKEISNKNTNKMFLTYLLILMLPQVVINSAWWAQCDSIYTSFCLLSLYFLIRKKTNISFIAYGIALSFKLQAIFMLPLYVILMFTKQYKVKWYHFLYIPITIITMNLPSIILGNNIIDIFKPYFVQTSEYSTKLTLNFSNIYAFFSNDNVQLISIVAIIITMLILLITLIFVYKNKIKFNNEKLITLLLWILIIVVFFLPRMHERYLYLGEVLSVIYYILYKKNLYVPLTLNITTIIIYIYVLAPNTWFFDSISINTFLKVFAIINLIMIIKYTIYIKKFLKENEQVRLQDKIINF